MVLFDGPNDDGEASYRRITCTRSGLVQNATCSGSRRLEQLQNSKSTVTPLIRLSESLVASMIR